MKSITKVVNRKNESFDIYIGRGTILGNPFSVSTLGRLKAIELYHEHYLPALRREGKVTDEFLLSLHGKTLGCSCCPNACHGDKLVEIIDQLYEKKNSV